MDNIRLGSCVQSLCKFIYVINCTLSELNKLSALKKNIIERLSQLILTLDIFLDTFSQESESDDFYIKVYDAVHLKCGKILRTTEDFQGKE